VQKKPTDLKPKIIHFRLTDKTHGTLKMEVAKQESTMQLWVEKLIEKALGKRMG